MHSSVPAVQGHGAGSNVQVLLNLVDMCRSCPGIADKGLGTNFMRAIMLSFFFRCGTIRRAFIPYLPT